MERRMGEKLDRSFMEVMGLYTIDSSEGERF